MRITIRCRCWPWVTAGEPPFPMFQRARADIIYLVQKEPFGHESYTSAALLRSLKNDHAFPSRTVP